MIYLASGKAKHERYFWLHKETAETLGVSPDVENEILEQEESNEASKDAEQIQEAPQSETIEKTPENVEENKE